MSLGEVELNKKLANIDFSDGEILGMLKDLPDACCIFQVVTDPFGTVKDMQFLFVNEKYASLVGKSAPELVGSTFYETVSNRDEDWIRLSYQAAIMRQSVINRTYNTKYNKWFEFWAVPVYKKGFCAFIIHDVTAEKREEENRTIQNNSNRIIIECAKSMNSNDFKTGINLVLEQLGNELSAARVFVVERKEDGSVGQFYSWSHKNTGIGLPTVKIFKKFDFFGMWQQQLDEDNISIINDIKSVNEHAPEIFEKILEGIITNYMVATLRDHDRIIGYMVADNYNYEADFDIENVFETVSMFVASELSNYNLKQEIDNLR